MALLSGDDWPISPQSDHDGNVMLVFDPINNARFDPIGSASSSSDDGLTKSHTSRAGDSPRQDGDHAEAWSASDTEETRYGHALEILGVLSTKIEVLKVLGDSDSNVAEVAASMEKSIVDLKSELMRESKEAQKELKHERYKAAQLEKTLAGHLEEQKCKAQEQLQIALDEARAATQIALDEARAAAIEREAREHLQVMFDEMRQDCESERARADEAENNVLCERKKVQEMEQAMGAFCLAATAPLNGNKESAPPRAPPPPPPPR